MKAMTMLKEMNIGKSKKATNDVAVKELQLLRKQIEMQADIIADLRRQANEDALTGVSNRRYFEKSLEQALSYYKRYGRSGAVLLIDINDFKSINDSLGHITGDAILIHVAKILGNVVRDTDLVARIGGDEFCIILREANDEDAMRKAEELSFHIAHSPCTYEGRDIYVSASIGHCSFEKATNREELLEKADSTMYKVKKDSKNARA